MDFRSPISSSFPATSARILIIKDEGAVTMDLGERLTGLGYEVVAVADVTADVAALARCSKIDLIVMDVQLRRQEFGIDAAGALRKTVDVPVISVTGRTGDSEFPRDGQAATFDSVVNPFDKRELRTTIEMALCLHERRKLETKVLRLESRGAEQAAELRATGGALREAELDRMMKEETQRREVATELHDFVGQDLAACRFKLGQLRRAVDAAQAEAVNECCELLDGAIESARTLVFELSPPMLHEIGLASALDWLAERYTKRYGLPVRFEQAETIDPLPATTRVLFFQAARELLANAIKHAEPTGIILRGARPEGRLCLAAVNDGKGFQAEPYATSGFGLARIRERALHFGGTLVIHSSSSGSTVELSIPLSA